MAGKKKETKLGSGLLERARKGMTDRNRRIEEEINKAQGRKKK